MSRSLPPSPDPHPPLATPLFLIVHAAGFVKKPKCLPSDTSGVEWASAYENGEVGGRNVEELKKFLKSRGEKVGGRKADLVNRIESLIEKDREGRKRGGDGRVTKVASV